MINNCKECNSPFQGKGYTKYCSDTCRTIVRRRVQIRDRDQRSARLKGEDKDFIVAHIFHKYKIRAERKKIEFNLDIGLFQEHFRGVCYYCKDTLFNVGFDRKDPKQGYILDNVVPCCTSCNMMKHTADVKTFITKCKVIAGLHTVEQVD